MKLLQGHIMDQHIVAPLQKSRVHGENRDHPLLGHTGGHGNAVALRNAHIEEPLRVGLLEYRQAGALLHGGGDGADAAVLPGAIAEGLAEYGGKGLSGCFFQKSGFRIKGGDPMKLTGITLRKGIALTFLGVDMDHHGAGELLGPCQHIAQAGQVMAVDGSQIGEAHVLKESASRPQCLFQAGFQPMVEAVDGGL